MAQQDLIIGAANGGTGDTYFDAFTKAQANFDELFAGELFTKRKLVNDLSDFPAPVSGVITLVADTQYRVANDISFDTNRVVYSNNSVISGIATIVITLTYIGVNPFLTAVDSTVSLNCVNVLHPNADLFDYTDSGSNVIRVSDVTGTGKAIGRLSGTTSLGRFTNYSPILTGNGLLLQGNWATFLFDSSFGAIVAGTYVDLGTATFDGFMFARPSITVLAGATFLSGLANSGNVNANGGATVIHGAIRNIGGTVLNNVTSEDVRWEFFHNNVIQDTRPDGLLSMQSNATNTVIAVATTPVLVAGTWVVERASQAAGTTAGRVTYEGSKPIIVPITARVSVEPASGTNKVISVYIAINGTVVAASAAPVKADSGSPLSITAIWQEVLATSDYVEVFVSNDTDTVDVLASSAVLRVN